MPALESALDLPLVDGWIRDAVAKYQALLTTRQGEHACTDELRRKGVIR